MRVSPSRGTSVVLTPEFTAACDPDVSVDGETIVFAGRRGPRHSWQIWKMKADGSGKTQVTRRPGQSVAPVFAGARFCLDDTQPTPQVILAGSAEDPGTFALYGPDPEGATLHRLTFNLQSDFSPAVLPWFELGGVYAVPNIRGGGEYGGFARWQRGSAGLGRGLLSGMPVKKLAPGRLRSYHDAPAKDVCPALWAGRSR